eukprot:CAMPEP_0198361026 /NCGR_PEP_ID=MMETSP1450-20131203/140704_1 /TAXON_ID=753684 ORGANISM="Madagascaria erythrocladiodes, Strain CCMP3234" /NCGR_SAMPLE_ID=MMETSP1450 /ASSEMBLY_ACC=CAM_ASM_001115 /LENGTH=42 /DNA_ID= /DNA_START= /DNA_END= /DNA_ORIENTATION=
MSARAKRKFVPPRKKKKLDVVVNADAGDGGGDLASHSRMLRD